MASSLSSVPPVWPQAAAAHHRNLEAARDGERGEDQRDLVADAAGGVLVDLGAGQVLQVDDFAGAHHGVRQPRRFLGGHAAPEDGHEQGGGLVVGELAVGDAAREELDLVLGQRAAVALLDDDVLGKKEDMEELRADRSLEPTEFEPSGRTAWFLSSQLSSTQHQPGFKRSVPPSTDRRRRGSRGLPRIRAGPRRGR